MKHLVAINGFENQKIEVQAAGIFSGVKLLVNGQEAPKGAKRGQFALVRDDGREVTASWKAGLGSFGGVPQLVVDGDVIDVVPSQSWYVLVWSALPMALIFLGGVIGAIVGVIAYSINRKVFESEQNTATKFILTGVVTVAALGIYLVVALMVSSVLG